MNGANKETTMDETTIGWLKINCIVEALAAEQARPRYAGRAARIRALRTELEAV